MSQFKENGQINTIFLPSLLIDIHKNQKNGSLELDSTSNLKIYFDKGTPFYSEGGDDETLLVRLLQKDNKITDTQYEEIIAKMNDTDSRVGEIIMNIGILNPHELNEYLEFQIREKIIRGLTYTQGSYNFEEMTEFPSSIFYCSLDINSIIFETLRRYVNTSGIDINQIKLKVSPELGGMLSKLNLGPKELRVAQQLTKSTNLTEIAGSKNAERERNIVLIFFLSLHKFVDIENFSVIEFCKNAFNEFRKEEQSDNLNGDESGQDENDIPIIDLEHEITENSGNIPEQGIEINVDEEAAENTLQINTGFQSDFNTDIEGIGLNVGNEDTKTYSEDPENYFTEDQSASDDNSIIHQKSVEIKTNDREYENKERSENYLQSDTITSDNKENNFRSGEGIEIASSTEEKKESVETEEPENKTEPTDGKDKSALIKEITEFYDFVSEQDDSYRILGIDKVSTDSEVKDAYFILVKKFHPDANPSFPKEIRSKAETIFTKVTQAYENLSSQNKRDTYESLKEVDKVKNQAQSIYDAEILYTEGELLLRQRRYKEASEKFFHAIELNSEEAAYIGALSWARFLSYENKNSIIKDSVKELEKATSMDEKVAENFYYLGSVYKFMNDTEKAETNFKKAVDINPHYIQAKRELRLIQNRKQNKDRKQKDNKGSDSNFWSGLFKK